MCWRQGEGSVNDMFGNSNTMIGNSPFTNWFQCFYALWINVNIIWCTTKGENISGGFTHSFVARNPAAQQTNIDSKVL